MSAPLLEVDSLKVSIALEDRAQDGVQDGGIHAVQGVSFTVEKGESVGLVGESGSGKSITAAAILGLLPPRAVVGGKILWRGDGGTVDLAGLSPRSEAMRRIRGRAIGMVFQETGLSLNPVETVGDQVAEAAAAHRALSRAHAHQRAVDLLEAVGIPAAARRAGDYPHQLSGGQRQRVMMAMALASDPALVIADEPTASLDVTVQAAVLDLLRRRREEKGMALLLISHDLGVVAETAERILVMKEGRIVESGPAARLLTAPEHPYTRALLAGASLALHA